MLSVAVHLKEVLVGQPNMFLCGEGPSLASVTTTARRRSGVQDVVNPTLPGVLPEQFSRRKLFFNVAAKVERHTR